MAAAKKKPATNRSDTSGRSGMGASSKGNPNKNVSKPTGPGTTSSRTSSAARKAGEDARGRATKYGQLTGKPTTVGGYGALLGGGLATGRKSEVGRKLVSSTEVKSARGNMYDVTEYKTQKDLGVRDSKPTTRVNPVRNTFKAAPTKKAAPKKK